jgi:ribosomal protein S18 acetylase RimI-like enzyme
MSGDLTIRRLAPDEFALFKAVRLEGLKSDPDAFASSHAQWAELSDNEWRQRLTEPVVVACMDALPIGMMALRLNRPEKMTHRAALSGVYVRAEFRGAGVAGKLLTEVVFSACQGGIKQIELGVRADNIAALRFYAHHGFEQFGRVPDGFRSETRTVDEVLMVLRLAKPQAGLAGGPGQASDTVKQVAGS